ncbi:MAG: aspartate/glutamate racemase family protein [Nitrososphaerota archaeon]|nr:aspartate/glutamate racemase family protein [Candidatus Bathyarchaeota archaeon]MDW8048694.1 aspartate/glutamate racemase family protein [Nitrososphaerota archaeon]
MVCVAAIYTGQGLMEIMRKIFAEEFPDCQLINILDDSIIREVMLHGGVTPFIARRLISYFFLAVDAGADIILNTCSSVGEVVDIARPIIEKPIVRIDEPMAEEAVKNFSVIGVLATVRSTLTPTINLLKKKALEENKDISIIQGLAEGAYQALMNGLPEMHDKLIMETASRISEKAEVIVLAQGSMTRIERVLAENTGKPVLSSPRLAVRTIKNMVNCSK